MEDNLKVEFNLTFNLFRKQHMSKLYHLLSIVSHHLYTHKEKIIKNGSIFSPKLDFFQTQEKSHIKTEIIETNFLTYNQKKYNTTIGKVLGKFERKNCNNTIILESVTDHLKTKNYVQVPRMCLFEVAAIIDEYNNISSFMDLPIVRGLTSKTKGQLRA
jgi:hypothetical protein